MATSYTESMSMANNETGLPSLSWKQIRDMNQINLTPFSLMLADDSILDCEKIIRIVPGKRLVAFGIWNDQPVVAKLFYNSSRAKRHFNEEINGIEALLISGVPTPKVLWKGTAQKHKIQIILFERILNATNLDELWHKKTSPEELLPLLQTVTLELATQHVLGILQRDLHLKNFLITDNKIYTIDGGSIAYRPQILSKEESIDHLGLFFSQLGVGTEDIQHQLLQTYIKARSWLVKKVDLYQLKKSIMTWTKKRWQRYEEKIQRNCTAFGCKKSLTQFTMYDRSYLTAEFDDFLKNPAVLFNQPNIDVLKAGNSSTVIKVQIGDRYFVIKRYNIKNSWHALRRCFRTTRAANSWNLAQRMCLFDIPTARPIAFIDKRFLGFKGKSYFVMEFVEGVHAGEFFSQYNTLEINKHFEIVAQRILKLIQNLARLHLIHGDLKMTNILISQTKPLLIDLDGMTEHKTNLGLKRAFQKEIKRFMKNWQTNRPVYTLFEKLL